MTLPKTTLKNVWVGCDAANQGAEVITLPELYSSHYFCQSDVDNFALAERFTAPRLSLSVL
jgi:predicted amidohydrolase